MRERTEKKTLSCNQEKYPGANLQLKIKITDKTNQTDFFDEEEEAPVNHIYKGLPDLQKVLQQVQVEEEAKEHAQKTTNEETVLANKPLYYSNLASEEPFYEKELL